ncbi:erythropoietin [Pseudophryne corroboree]|uniref:erythropoietin n=1 Tax=Pseudophryne corroboree TaxID=495146 RepID=UPI003081525F
MGVTGLLILLQMLLVTVKLLSAAPTTCNIVDPLIRAALEQEKLMNIPCDFDEGVSVPEPNMNAEWRKLQTPQQADEVQQGLALLLASAPKVKTFLSKCRLDWSSHIFSSNTRTLKNVLERFQTQAGAHMAQREARTLAVHTSQQFYTVYRNFLQGKYKTLLLSECKRAQRK